MEIRKETNLELGVAEANAATLEVLIYVTMAAASSNMCDHDDIATAVEALYQRAKANTEELHNIYAFLQKDNPAFAGGKKSPLPAQQTESEQA